MNDLKKPFIIADTEFTTWEGAQARGWSGPNEHREIVQIAAVKVGHDYEELEALDILVKPLKNPQLSDFFIGLTGLTQKQVDEQGLTLAEALEVFNSFREGLPVWSYGRDDHVIAENCQLIGLNCPLTDFQDICDIVRACGVDPSSYLSGTVHKAANADMQGHVHNALFDCRSILAFLKASHKA